MQAPHGAAAGAGQPPELTAAEARLQRTLKVVVAVLAVLLLAGLLAVAGRVIYLASSKEAQPAAAPPVPGAAAAAEHALELPAGAQVRTMTLSGSRLAVQYEAPTGAGIAIIDLDSGRVLSRVVIRAAP